MSILAIFNKPKPFDLEATLAAWPDAPHFEGKRKKDMPVADWLEQIRAGCAERKVPEERYVDVAQALMGEKARARLEEFSRVLVSMSKGEFKWDWKRFHLAMTSMGWEISGKERKFFTVAAKRCGKWWVVGKKGESLKDDSASITSVETRPKVSRKSSVASSISSAVGHMKTRSATSDDRDWVSVSTLTKSEKAAEVKEAAVVVAPPPRKTPIRAMSDSIVSVMRPSVESKPEKGERAIVAKPPGPVRANTEPVATTVANAPLWLVNAQTAIDYLTAEYPKTCTTLSAILLAAGTIPAIAASGGAAVPAVAPLMTAITTAGGGAVIHALGSSTAIAFGAVATGLGSWLKTQTEQKSVNPPPAAAIAAA